RGSRRGRDPHDRRPRRPALRLQRELSAGTSAARPARDLGAIVAAVAAVVVSAAGIAYRQRWLGAYGFWNDEAWVAITTRVPLGSQVVLSLSVTPPGRALLLRLAPADAPEWALRAVPFLFGCATIWMAWFLGQALGGRLAGALAVAAVALDPLEIAFAKQLKQYTAESFFTLLTLAGLVAATRSPGRAATWTLAGVLCLATAF